MSIIMGVLNITPDSFYDGGQFVDYNKAIDQAHQMVEAGATIIDVGGESTRPGAKSLSLSEECDRVLPIIESLANTLLPHITLSIDTRHPEVMCQAMMKGAKLINDVSALQAPGAHEALAMIKQRGAQVCLMHMQGQPDTMQINPDYMDVVREVKDFLAARIDFCVANGLDKNNIIIDPGFGFGKTPEHNALLLKNLSVFKTLGCKILVGLSRKSCIEHWIKSKLPFADRLPGSLAAAVVATLNGADIVRVHDVRETVQALKIAEIFK